eukprot:366352-Chlamydomonas_euryale.AAC.5
MPRPPTLPHLCTQMRLTPAGKPRREAASGRSRRLAASCSTQVWAAVRASWHTRTPWKTAAARRRGPAVAAPRGSAGRARSSLASLPPRLLPAPAPRAPSQRRARRRCAQRRC